MKFQSAAYHQFEGQPQEWRFDEVAFDAVTLLVGKNASGKTRTLNVIAGLARLLGGEIKPHFVSGNYAFKFDDRPDAYAYELKLKQSTVEYESLRKNGQVLLERGADGAGKIFSEKRGELVEFQAPTSDLAAAVRRDNIQHSFFEKLYQWGKGMRHFSFGTALGKSHYLILRDEKDALDSSSDTNKVVETFRRAVGKFGDKFVANVIEDMNAVDYEITAVGAKNASMIQATDPAFGPLCGMYVKEKGLNIETEQYDMSQGMFRVLSIVTQLCYAELSNAPTLILVDDIGEGLDFERSCRLVKLLIEKAKRSGVQLLMSTNDRFVMNAVPLEHWCVIQRTGGICKFYNYRNSRQKFEDFKFTGMNNFDFFATDFLNS